MINRLLRHPLSLLSHTSSAVDILLNNKYYCNCNYSLPLLFDGFVFFLFDCTVVVVVVVVGYRQRQLRSRRNQGY